MDNRNKCSSCIFFKREHHLDANLLHYVVYFCWITGKDVEKDCYGCRFFVDEKYLPKKDIITPEG